MGSEMKKISILNRLILFVTSLLAAYQIAIGIEGFNDLSLNSYTVAFGVLLIASLLLMILGYEALESQPVVIISTLIPLSLALGLVAEHMPAIKIAYLVFAIVGLIVITLSRYTLQPKFATIILAVVHGIAGMTIFWLPIYLCFAGKMLYGFILVSVGGALIGVGGLLLSLLKAGKPLLSEERILAMLPGLLLATTAAFVAGFLLS
jgi:hypothetical protein